MTLSQSLQLVRVTGKGLRKFPCIAHLRWSILKSILCLLVMQLGAIACINQSSGPVKKSPTAERPAAPLPTSTPAWGQFSPDQLYSALRATFLKSKAVESAQLSAAEKCEIREGTQIVLKNPPTASANKHWKVELQLKIPGCALESGYLFTGHWKQSPSSGGNITSSDGCNFPSEMDFETGRQLAQESNRINIGAFTGRCYEYAGVAIENVGLMPKGSAAWSAAGVPTRSAADFVQVENSSKAGNFVRLRPSSWSCLPEGTIVVWDRGVCGFNSTHGHIEIVVSRDGTNPSQTRLCSDGCQSLQTACSIQSGVSFFFPRKL